MECILPAKGLQTFSLVKLSCRGTVFLDQADVFTVVKEYPLEYKLVSNIWFKAATELGRGMGYRNYYFFSTGPSNDTEEFWYYVRQIKSFLQTPGPRGYLPKNFHFVLSPGQLHFVPGHLYIVAEELGTEKVIEYIQNLGLSPVEMRVRYDPHGTHWMDRPLYQFLTARCREEKERERAMVVSSIFHAEGVNIPRELIEKVVYYLILIA